MLDVLECMFSFANFSQHALHRDVFVLFLASTDHVSALDDDEASINDPLLDEFYNARIGYGMYSLLYYWARPKYGIPFYNSYILSEELGSFQFGY